MHKLCTILLPILLLCSIEAVAKKPEVFLANQDFEVEVRAVDFAIRHYMRLNPGKRIMRSAEIRKEMAEAIVSAARKHEVPPLLLTTIIYHESTFETSAKGALGEIGLMQVHGLAARGCDLQTLEGQLDCGAEWLAHFYPKCQTWKGAVTAYGTRGSCVATTPRNEDKMRYRLKQWAKVETEAAKFLSTDLGG